MIYDVSGSLKIDPRVRDWCKLRYPGHPKGCPNYNKSSDCPERVKLIGEVFNLTEGHWFIIEPFDIKAHAWRMKLLHPKWSDRQCRCVLYWQNRVKSKLRRECMIFISGMEQPEGDIIYTLIPEAMGVNVFRTCHRLGIKMRKNPQDILYKVALVGWRI